MSKCDAQESVEVLIREKKRTHEAFAICASYISNKQKLEPKTKKHGLIYKDKV